MVFDICYCSVCRNGRNKILFRDQIQNIKNSLPRRSQSQSDFAAIIKLSKIPILILEPMTNVLKNNIMLMKRSVPDELSVDRPRELLIKCLVRDPV